MTDDNNSLPPCEEPIEAPMEGEWRDKYLRLLAEQENLRKRVLKEKHEMVQFGVDNAIGEFLPAMDQLESALLYAEQASPEVKNWAFGFTMILAQFKEILQGHGIESFSSEGEMFDPRLHEAVEMEETVDVPEGVILKEFTKGYKSKIRILRPARVKVAQKPKDQDVVEKDSKN